MVAVVDELVTCRFVRPDGSRCAQSKGLKLSRWTMADLIVFWPLLREEFARAGINVEAAEHSD